MELLRMLFDQNKNVCFRSEAAIHPYLSLLMILNRNYQLSPHLNR